MKVFLIAGEPSGDLLGARLMRALKQESGDLSFLGVGGPRMEAEGLASRFPMNDLTLFGVAELIPKIPLVLKRIRQTARAIAREKPDVVVTIDAPDFCFRVAKKLAGSGIPFVHYVAPTVWAWRPGRAKTIHPWFRHLLTLFPFEPPYFARVGLPATCVGHPLVEAGIEAASGAHFRQRHTIPPDRPVLVVLPGSRRSELRFLLADFGETVRRLIASHPDLQVVIPTVPHLFDAVRAATAHWPGAPLLVSGDDDKYGAFAAATAALAASGTVALELALAGTPAVIAYRIHPVTAALYRRFIRTKYANLVNILADKLAVPEFLQENCTPTNLTAALHQLLTSPEARATQRATLSQVRGWLSPPDPAVTPSQHAARVVLSVARREPDPTTAIR